MFANVFENVNTFLELQVIFSIDNILNIQPTYITKTDDQWVEEKQQCFETIKQEPLISGTKQRKYIKIVQKKFPDITSILHLI